MVKMNHRAKQKPTATRHSSTKGVSMCGRMVIMMSLKSRAEMEPLWARSRCTKACRACSSCISCGGEREWGEGGEVLDRTYKCFLLCNCMGHTPLKPTSAYNLHKAQYTHTNTQTHKHSAFVLMGPLAPSPPSQLQPAFARDEVSSRLRTHRPACLPWGVTWVFHTLPNPPLNTLKGETHKHTCTQTWAHTASWLITQLLTLSLFFHTHTHTQIQGDDSRLRWDSSQKAFEINSHYRYL